MVESDVMSAHSDDGKGPQGSETLRVLAVSDEIEPQLYNASLRDWLGHVDLIVSCGDLPSNYLDFLVSTTRLPGAARPLLTLDSIT
jgi:hypothetical protein